MALGSTRGGVQWLIVRESLVVVLSGLALGIPVALATGKGMAGLLFGLNAADPQTLIGATAVIVVVTLSASYIPAWRASRLDPMIALRTE